MRWWKRWGPSLLIMTLIFLASGTPGNELPDFGPWNFDIYKASHMTGYALLAIAFLHALAYSRPASRRLQFLSVFLSGLYAVTDEFHQRFTVGRTPSPVDVGIDVAGATIGILLWIWIRSAWKAGKTAGVK